MTSQDRSSISVKYKIKMWGGKSFSGKNIFALIPTGFCKPLPVITCRHLRWKNWLVYLKYDWWLVNPITWGLTFPTCSLGSSSDECLTIHPQKCGRSSKECTRVKLNSEFLLSVMSGTTPILSFTVEQVQGFHQTAVRKTLWSVTAMNNLNKLPKTKVFCHESLSVIYFVLPRKLSTL